MSRDELVSEIKSELELLGYEPTQKGIEEALDEWCVQKADIIEAFKKHQYYNGKLQIVFPADYAREIDIQTVNSFINYVTRTLSENGKEKEATDFGYMFRYKIKSQFVDEEMKNCVNNVLPEIKANVGQKVSRVVRKVCVHYGVDKMTDDFDNVIKETDEAGHSIVIKNAKFPTFADAVNPLNVTKWTVLSVHPLDYLFMSHGTSWASCHMIDIMGDGGWNNTNSYSGQYSGGTVSYMLDPSSIVFYTVDSSYEGNEFELQPKMQRNMFHIDKDRIVQGRVYPQGNDGGTDIYRQFRNIVQKVWSDCIGEPNYWQNIKGTSECEDNIESKGVHYRDYEHYSDCNVSYRKSLDESARKMLPRMRVGARKICMSCGGSDNESENIFCSDCAPGQKCYACGCRIGEYNGRYVENEGEWYCEDCSWYCECCEQYVVGDSTEVKWGRYTEYVCDDCIDNCSEIVRCAHCDEHFNKDTVDGWIETEDGTFFCDYECAEYGGYSETSDGYWYPEDEVHYCEKCDNYVHEDEWDSEQECCLGCVELDEMEG